MASHKIVVARVPADKQAAVSQALTQTLGIGKEYADPIASSAPIVILDGLEPEQATAIKAALAPVEQAGAQLAISAAESSSMAQINWQDSPPQVAGRGVETYKPGYTPPAPPPQPVAPAPVAPAPAAPRPASSAGSGARPVAMAPGVQAVCPHCGRPIQIVLSPAGAPVSTGTGIQQVPVPPGLADTGNAAFGSGIPAPLPEVPNVPPARPAGKPPSSSATRAGPMDLEEFERGVGGGKPPSASADALLRQLDASLPAKDPGLRALEGEDEAPPKGPPRGSPKGRKRTTPSPKGGAARRFRDRRR